MLAPTAHAAQPTPHHSCPNRSHLAHKPLVAVLKGPREHVKVEGAGAVGALLWGARERRGFEDVGCGEACMFSVCVSAGVLTSWDQT